MGVARAGAYAGVMTTTTQLVPAIGRSDDWFVEPAPIPLAEAPERTPVVLAGRVVSVQTAQWAGGLVVEVTLVDGDVSLVLVFFSLARAAGLQGGDRAGRVGHDRTAPRPCGHAQPRDLVPAPVAGRRPPRVAATR